MSTSFSPQIGERFAGRYELMSPLRSDGAVRSFLALDHHAGLDVALLLLDPARAHPNAWAAFARIVAAATAGKIAGLVLPQGVVSAPPVPPFCLAEPQTFRGFDQLRDQGPMPWRRALTLGERAAEVLLAALAATGVAHRVLTPSRCGVTVRDDVRVLDFGMAELELDRPDEAGYRAPEQQQGGGDARSDVYTLAVILTELISGQKSAGKTPPRLRSLAAVPQSVDAFMARALSRDPAQRPELAAMRAGLRELLSDGTKPAAAPRHTPKPEISPVSILSAPPSATPRTKPRAVDGAGPALANGAIQPARPSAPSAAASAAPPMPRSEVYRLRPPALDGRTELLPPASPTPAPAIRERTELLPPVAPKPASAEKTELFPPVAPKPASAEKTELLPPVSPNTAPAIRYRTEIFPPAAPNPAAALSDKTEIFPPVALNPAPPLTDRTEIFPPIALNPAPPVTDRTELLPSVPRSTEVVRADVAIVGGEQRTASGKPLIGPLALAQAKASAAVPIPIPRATAGDEPPPATIITPPIPADTTLLLPPEPAGPAPTVGPLFVDQRPREPIGVQPTAEVRPPAAEPAPATAMSASARPSTSSKPAEKSFKKASIWIYVACFAGLVLALLWLLIR
ncbi:hypothetical protein [Nannocystis pusilla]|uniref:hypothetical protein n=1 Tax=Nannocystis pusilla TaxID=889268 RepID=UPI003BF3FBDD